VSLFRNFAKDLASGVLGNDYLRDYKHASKVFVSDNMAYAPRLKFLYHSYFEINTASPALRALYPRSDQSRIGLMVKSFQLPQFDVQTDTMNQYNRHRIIQTGIKYSPVTIELHDDGSDIVRNLWRQYYTYYYGDTVSPNSEVGKRNIYTYNVDYHNWGYSGAPFGDNNAVSSGVKLPFFSSIYVYGLNQKANIGYQFVNPIIKSWQHDTYDYSVKEESMRNRVQIEYEYVRYFDQTEATGFADPATYDTAPSPLGRAGSTTSIFGPGGIFDSGGQILENIRDGNILGAAVNTVRTVRTGRNINIRDAVRGEVTGRVADIARSGATTARNIFIPR
jgi:hypothetical protein